MPKHAHNNSMKKRLVSTRGAIVAGTFAAIACATLAGTAQAAEPSAAKNAPHTAGTAHAKHGAHWRGHHSFTTYTVKPGDTLIGIARAHKSPGGWHAIAWANKIHSPYIIHPGQALKVPAGKATPAKSGASASSTSSASSSATTAKAAPSAASSSSATTSTATTASDASATTTTATQTYPDNLDGWINQALAIMKQNGIPGSYDGIYRNIMRESSGNPNAINNWDSNAAAGTPSKGLLQTIQPTFDAYHVAGTSNDIYDPVANIVAACNYAYHVYGSIDNVNGPY
ncbi:LysM peptidoglycan-binding domain-containing protein [Streptomyces sp. NBC_00669]|uniref:transglycosylase SLT domain-containing protein n=1 Tax=unclassified Streptomyces TaxID=2593676 RepID=UPI002E374FAD|nr:LysM peptidoglycan-binding domain-containing protein [Streptomyces sp. NBC_00669]